MSTASVMPHMTPSERAHFHATIRGKRFLPPQARWVQDRSRLKICEKSRQIGFSWCDAYDSVTETAGAAWPFDCWITSRDQIQAQLYAQDCAFWAKVLDTAAGDLGEAVITTEKGEKVSALRLPFANGMSIYSLSSNVDAQAGKRGTRKLDEFALNKDNRRLYGIAYPGTTWGGRLVIFSTHRGTQNYFNELIEEVKHKGNPKGFSLHTITLEDALRDGLLVKLKDKWAKTNAEDPRLAMDEDEYLAYTRAQCPDEETFLEEYMCQPSSDDSAFLTYDLINGCRYTAEDGRWEKDLRECGPLFVGVDIGRSHDLAVIWVLERVGGTLETRRVIELANTPFRQQRNTLFPILDLPNVQRCCIDATGLGADLAEDAREIFGWKVEEVTFTGAVKEGLAYPLRAHFEDRTIRVPDSRVIIADLRAVKKIVTPAGNIRFAADRGKNGHADRFWALALGVEAASNLQDAGEFHRFTRRLAAEGHTARQILRRRRELVG